MRKTAQKKPENQEMKKKCLRKRKQFPFYFLLSAFATLLTKLLVEEDVRVHCALQVVLVHVQLHDDMMYLAAYRRCWRSRPGPSNLLHTTGVRIRFKPFSCQQK